MKLKLTIALVILALVFGMVLAACDDGDVPTITQTQKDVGGTKHITDKDLDTALIPYLDGNAKDAASGVINGPTGDTSGNNKPNTTSKPSLVAD
jgi:hypothetical protein